MLLAYFGQRLLRTLLFGVEASVPWVLGASAVVVLLVSMLASYLPARRAGHVNPADALRAE
jgi:ABC-type lipoprotein release transport system permease subunit